MHQGGNLQDLKAFLAKGIPVVVDLALTPFAHTPSPLVAARAEMIGSKGVTIEKGNPRSLSMTAEATARFRGLVAESGGPRSGVLGKMVSLDTFRTWERLLQMSPWESLFYADRVVIGYDDEQQVASTIPPSVQFGRSVMLTSTEGHSRRRSGRPLADQPCAGGRLTWPAALRAPPRSSAGRPRDKTS